ncbi:hypothetical protein ACYOEI_07490 [Singulisphaera rosea]
MWDRYYFVLFMVSVASSAGCEGSSGPAPVPRFEIGPHRGSAFRLPSNQGYVELVNEPEVVDRRTDPSTAVVAYFFQEDGKSPMATPPTEVSIRLDQGRRKSETLRLQPEPRADDPSGGCRFASKRGPFSLDTTRGRFKANLAGGTFERELVEGR